MENKYFIYKYTFPNGKVYIGQTSTDGNRYGRSSAYKGQFVHNAMMKYPEYTKEILEENISVDDIDDKEKYYITFYDSTNRSKGYNRESGGNKFKKQSEESKKLKSFKLKGRPFTDEHRRNISKGQLGKILTEEHKTKISMNNTRRKAVLCIETNEIFSSASDAAKYYQIKNPRSVSNAANINRAEKTAGGYHWEYV